MGRSPTLSPGASLHAGILPHRSRRPRGDRHPAASPDGQADGRPDRTAEKPARRRSRIPAGSVHAPRSRRRGRRRSGQGLLPGRRRAGQGILPPDRRPPRHRAAGHHAGRLQHQRPDRVAGPRRPGAGRRRGPEKDPAGLRRLPRHRGKGQGRQRPSSGRAAKLGRRRMVHQPPRSPAEHDPDRVQGHRRDQHRRPVARPRRLEPPGHPAARAGDAEEPARRHHARRTRATASRPTPPARSVRSSC